MRVCLLVNWPSSITDGSFSSHHYKLWMLQDSSAEEPWERAFPPCCRGQAVELSVAMFWSKGDTILTTHIFLSYTGNLQSKNVQRSPNHVPPTPWKTSNLKLNVFWDQWSSGTWKVSEDISEGSIREIYQSIYYRKFVIDNCGASMAVKSTGQDVRKDWTLRS